MVVRVEDGVAGVQLDGGEGGLPGGGGGGHGDGTSGVGDSSGSDDLRGGMGDVGHNGGGRGSSDGRNQAVSVGSGKGKASVGSKAGKGETSSDNLGRPPLPLSGGGGSLLGGVGSSEGGLGVNDLLGVTDLDSLEDGGGGLDSLEDRGGQLGGPGHGQVGALHAESVHVIRDVVDSLDKTVGIKVLVGPGGHSVGVTGLSPGGRAAGVAEGELAELILGVELVGGGGGGDC